MPAIPRHHRYSLTSQGMPRVGNFHFWWKPVGVVLQCVTDFKGLTGLDEHQVRTWTSWHRWTILALLAHAFLSVLASQAGDSHSRDDLLIPLTRHEIRRLFTGLGQQPPAPAMQLHWSRWRRRHQAAAQASHYRRRARTLS